MLYTQHGEPVEVVSGRCHDLLDPVTLDVPAYQVRSLNDPTWVVVRMMHQLKADGGVAEIDAAFKAADEKYGEKDPPPLPIQASRFTLFARKEEDGAREQICSYETLDEACEEGDRLLDGGYHEYFVHDAKGVKVQHVCGGWHAGLAVVAGRVVGHPDRLGHPPHRTCVGRPAVAQPTRPHGDAEVSEFKGTPGPWQSVGEGDGGFDVDCATPGGRFLLATAWYDESGATDSKVIADANARLIASCPDLLAALEQIAELAGDCENQKFALTRFQASQIARAAIHKAKGE